MSAARGGLQFVSTSASGWCDPDTGVCHIDADDEDATVASGTSSDVPDATQR